jgi:hypothetical protein
MRLLLLALLLLPASALASTSTNEKAAAGGAAALILTASGAVGLRKGRQRALRKRAEAHGENLALRFKWSEGRKKREIENLVRRGMR